MIRSPENSDSMDKAMQNIEREVKRTAGEVLSEAEWKAETKRTELGEFSSLVSEDILSGQFEKKIPRIRELMTESKAKTWEEFVKSPQYPEYQQIASDIETQKNILIARLNSFKQGPGRIDNADLARFGGEIERIMNLLGSEDENLKAALAWAAKFSNGKSIDDESERRKNYEILGATITNGTARQKELAHMIVAMLPEIKREEFASNFIAEMETAEEKKAALESLSVGGALSHLEIKNILDKEGIAYSNEELENYHKNWNEKVLRTEIARALETNPYGVKNEAMELLSLKGLGKGAVYVWLSTIIFMNIMRGLPKKFTAEEIGKAIKGYAVNPYILGSAGGIATLRFYGNGNSLLEFMESGDRKSQLRKKEAAKYLGKMPVQLKSFVEKKGGRQLISEYVGHLRQQKKATTLSKDDFSILQFENFLTEKVKEDPATYKTVQESYIAIRNDISDEQLVSVMDAFDAWGFISPASEEAYINLVKYSETHY